MSAERMPSAGELRNAYAAIVGIEVLGVEKPRNSCAVSGKGSRNAPLSRRSEAVALLHAAHAEGEVVAPRLCGTVYPGVRRGESVGRDLFSMKTIVC